MSTFFQPVKENFQAAKQDLQPPGHLMGKPEECAGAEVANLLS